MRTTLDVDEDVLLAVKERARREGRSAGAVLSELARQALVHVPDTATESFFGFTPLPRRDIVVSNEQVNRIRDEEGV